MAWHKRSEGRREVEIGGGFWGGVENATHNHAVGAPRGTFDLLISLLCMYILSLVPKGTGEAEWLAFLNFITASVAQELQWKVNALTPCTASNLPYRLRESQAGIPFSFFHNQSVMLPTMSIIKFSWQAGL